jgi:hypothetical protein
LATSSHLLSQRRRRLPPAPLGLRASPTFPTTSVPIPTIFHAPVGMVKGHDPHALFTILFDPFIKSSKRSIKFRSDLDLNITISFSSAHYHPYALETTLEVNQLSIDSSPPSATPLPSMAASHHPVGTKEVVSPGHSLPVGVFCTGKIQGGQYCTFLIRGGLANYKAHYSLFWFRPLLGGNSPMSSDLILNMNNGYNGVSRELEK